MRSILELLCNAPIGNWREGLHGPDSVFVRTARIKSENLGMLTERLTDDQKKLLEAYFDADTKIENMIEYDRFAYALHLGAQLMAEMMRGKQELLK